MIIAELFLTCVRKCPHQVEVVSSIFYVFCSCKISEYIYSHLFSGFTETSYLKYLSSSLDCCDSSILSLDTALKVPPPCKYTFSGFWGRNGSILSSFGDVSGDGDENGLSMYWSWYGTVDSKLSSIVVRSVGRAEKWYLKSHLQNTSINKFGGQGVTRFHLQKYRLQPMECWDSCVNIDCSIWRKVQQRLESKLRLAKVSRTGSLDKNSQSPFCGDDWWRLTR